MAGNITKRFEADYPREVQSVDSDERSYYGSGQFYIPSAEEHGAAPFGGVQSGQIIGDIPAAGEEKDEWQLLAAGYDASGEKLTRNAGKEGRVAAFDFTFTATKSLSAVWAASKIANTNLADEIQRHFEGATKEALKLLEERAVFGVTRNSATGETHNVPLNIIAGMFQHETSREDDPHLHIHALILNAGKVRDMEARAALIGADPDKKLAEYLCLESKYLMQYQNAAASIGHVHLAWEMKKLGLAVRDGEYTFDIDHVPPQLIDMWSKRTTQVEVHATAYAMGLRGGMKQDMQAEYLAAARAVISSQNVDGVSPEVSAAAQSFREKLDQDYGGSTEVYFEQHRNVWRAATLDTRAEKSGATNTDLYERWKQDLAQLNLTPEHVIDATIASKYEQAPPFSRMDAMDAAEAKAMKGSWVSEAEVYRHAFDAVTGHMSVEDAKLFAEQFIDDRLIKIGYDPIKQTNLYTTQEMLDLEQGLLETVVNAKHGALDEAVVQRILKADAESGRPMTEEQRTAALSAIQSDYAITAIEGTAGAGKSHTMKTVVQAYRESGYEVHATALTWQAADNLKKSTEMDRSAALTGFINSLDRGEVQLTRKSLIVVDEAGLVGSRQMAALAKHVEQAGAKMILSGDSKQLSPVEGASIFKTVVREIGQARQGEGYARIDFIYRQKNEAHRAAVYDFMAGKAGNAIASYAKAGNVKLIDGGNTATVKAAVNSAWDYAQKCKTEGREAKQLILAVDNKSVREANIAFQQKRLTAGELDATRSVQVQGAAGVIELHTGDQIQFRINDKKDEHGNRRFTNRDRAEIVSIEKGKGANDSAVLTLKMENKTLQLRMDDEALADPKSGRKGLDLAYGVSVYSSQGATVDRVDLVANNKYSRELAYVAASRHQHEIEFHVDKRSLAEQMNDGRPGTERRDLKSITDSEIMGQMAFTWSRDNDMGSAIEMKRMNDVMTKAEIKAMKEAEQAANRARMTGQRKTAEAAFPEKHGKAKPKETADKSQRASAREAETKRAADRIIEQARQRAAELERQRQEEKRRQEQAAKRGTRI